MNAPDDRSILVVEDERLVALDLQEMLEEFGYPRPVVASSADEALASATERRPRLVLMDVRINGPQDGIATAEQLVHRFDVPVIYLTAHADDTTLSRAAATTPYGYLLKPIKPAELRCAVEVSLVRHDLERQQRRRERWTTSVLESIADAVIAVGRDGRVVFMNAAAELLTGIAVREAIGRVASEVVRRPDATADTSLAVALKDERVVHAGEGRIVNQATSREHVVLETAAPVIDGPSHAVLGAVLVLRDLTEQRRLDARLEVAERLASVGTLAAGVAHELNNPLSVVTMNVEYVKEELERARATHGTPPTSRPNAEHVARALDDVKTAAARISQIVADLKVFTRPPSNESQTVDLERVVQWAVRATAHEFRGRARVELRLERVPAVMGTDARIGQVLVNLLINAAQALPSGDGEAQTVTISTGLAPDGRVAVGVSDTGPGIPEAVLPYIFEPFFTTKRDQGGSGLGLAICHSIVTALGGEIGVDSVAGRGTSIQLLLPVASAHRATPAEVDVAPAAPAGRVLVVDDEPLLLEMMRRLLPAYDVELFTDARGALARIDAGHRYDVIVSDVVLPGMSGTALLEELRTRYPDLAGRLIFTSGAVQDPALDAALSAFPNRRLGKPFSGAALRAVVAQVLAEHAGQPAANDPR